MSTGAGRSAQWCGAGRGDRGSLLRWHRARVGRSGSIGVGGREGRVVATRSVSPATVPRSWAGRNPRSGGLGRGPGTEDSGQVSFPSGTGGRAAHPPPAAPTPAAARNSGFFALAAFFNNQTPRLSPSQGAQTPAGVVTGALNAVDPDSDQLTFAVTSQAAHGTATVSRRLLDLCPGSGVALTGVTDSFEVTVSDAASGFALHGLAGLVQCSASGPIGRRGDSSSATVVVAVAPFDAVNTPQPAGPPSPASTRSPGGQRFRQRQRTPTVTVSATPLPSARPKAP